jgi:flagellar biosynthesis protein FliR
MIMRNKKASVVTSVVKWIFAVFFYFTIGIKIVSPIVELLNTYEGAMGFMAGIVPFIPVLGLMWWGYTIIEADEQEEYVE